METKAVLELEGGRVFRVGIGDLLSEPVDAIVNAANGRLAHGGGVAAAIAEAAGDELEEDGEAYLAAHGPLETGEATVTRAGRLPFKGVIHAVGPRLGEGDEEALLSTAIASALCCAHERGWRSVSFPAVSSGIFAVPYPVCARAYLAGVAEHFEEFPDSSLQEVRLCLFLGPLVDEVLRVVAERQADSMRG